MNSNTKFEPMVIQVNSVANINPVVIQTALMDYGIVVIRPFYPPTINELEIVASNVGTLLFNHDPKFFASDSGATLRVSGEKDSDGHATGLFGSNELNWHCDYAHTPGEYHGTMLFNAKGGGETPTIFANTVAALESYETKHGPVEQRVGYHNVSYNAFVGDKSPSELRLLRMKGYDINNANFMKCCIQDVDTPRDLVMEHPITKKRSLYLSPATIQHFVPKLDITEYNAMVSELRNHEYVHVWKPSDIVLFDNLTTIHRRGKLSDDSERILFRTQFNYVDSINDF